MIHKIEPFKITIENHGIKVTTEMPFDSGLDQIKCAIIGMLVSISWNNSAVEEEFGTGFEESSTFYRPQE